jgi:Protein of unknown function (DUF3089)
VPKTRWIVCLLLVSSAVACGDDADDAPPDAGKDNDAGSNAGPHKLDRSELTAISTTGRLDYATPEYWVCRPDIEPNECERDLDATEVKPDGTLAVVKHVPASAPEFDCFYVYPTIWLNKTAQMNDFSEDGVNLVLDPLLSQAARFNRICRLYAPLYRQAGLNVDRLAEGADKQLALQDVRDAFAHYLEHDNDGRKFVLLGHSQGSFMLSSLIARDIDDNPELRERMISALLIGGQPYTTPGERTGGSFKNIPLCAEQGETGCVIAFNSFPKEAPPGADALVGRVTEELANEEVDLAGKVMCVDPAKLVDDGDRYAGSYFALSLHNPDFGMPERPPGVDTPFMVYRDLLRGECQYKDGLSYLEISADPRPGDMREVPPYRNLLIESIGFGLHLVDYNIPLDDLIAAVELQATAALR